MVIKKQVFLVALLGLALLAFSGCASKSGTETGMKNQAMGPKESLQSKPIGVMEGRTSAGMLPVYFDFDKSTVRKDQASRIQANAAFMKKHPKMVVRIEGNCDPRGTAEYNMALGERRALSAKKYLINLGVPAADLRTISYGKERILVEGNNEAAWAKDRRDDFVIVK